MSYVGNKPAQTTIPADDAVTTTMLQDDAVTSAKIAGTTIVNADINASAGIALSKLASDPTYDDAGLQDDVALLGFKVASNGSLARYNLVDQSIDAFEDTSGVDASGSTDEIRNASNYYSGFVAGSDTITSFTTAETTTWTTPAGITSAEILTVAGGGGGAGSNAGNESGGGAGAGGVVHNTSYTVVPAVVYDLTVGAGGAGGVNESVGSSGSNSVFNINAEGSGSTVTALGGGGGDINSTGLDGGSGGGTGQGTAGGGSATQGDSGGGTGYGNDGGGGGIINYSASGGGAGGVGNPGDTSASKGGRGGTGRLFSTFVAYGTDSSNAASTGSNGGYFSGGGSGGSTSFAALGPPTGGGGVGGMDSNGGVALVNTGGGGGGAGGATANGGLGGTGIVIIKYTASGDNNDMTLISNAVTAESAPTTGDLVITYTDGTGTATINTDLKAYISRDGSAYTSAVTLASQGTTGGHTILTAHDVDLSGITSGTSMKWKVETLNQGTAKETRIQAVSLGWS